MFDKVKKVWRRRSCRCPKYKAWKNKREVSEVTSLSGSNSCVGSRVSANNTLTSVTSQTHTLTNVTSKTHTLANVTSKTHTLTNVTSQNHTLANASSQTWDCPWSLIKRGTISQADIESPYWNNQCTAMALTAAVFHEIKSIRIWDSDDIDRVLFQGDKNHRVYRDSFKFSADSDSRISLDDITERKAFPVYLPDITGIAHPDKDWAGAITYPNDTFFDDELKLSCPSLISVLKNELAVDSPIVATIGMFSIGFIKFKGSIWLFDSHARTDRGNLNTIDGKAFTVPFSSVDDIEEYLTSQYKDSQYFACSFKFSFPAVESDDGVNAIKDIEKSLS